MVDISLEILATSVAVKSGCVTRYRVKTWWAHIDLPTNVTSVKLPRLPMIQQYLVMTGKDTTIFLETWQEEGDKVTNKRSFIGITTCHVDEQLKNVKLNPSVEWLNIQDPINNVMRGKVLLKIDAKFALPPSPNSKANENGEEQEFPVKIIHSPRRDLEEDQNSPTKYSTSSQLSRKSDTSRFSSVTSVTSSKSQEQGIQTELSLPVFPGVPKYSSLKSKSTGTTLGDHQRKKLLSSHAPLASPIIDPMKLAEQILLQHSERNKRRSEPVSSKPPIPKPSSNDVARKQLQSRSNSDDIVDERRPSKDFDVDVEDIIDMLNAGANIDDIFSSPQKSKSQMKNIPERAELSHRPKSLPSTSHQTTKNLNEYRDCKDRGDNGPPRTASNRRDNFGNQGKIVNTQNVEDDTGNDASPLFSHRFKEVHFDGALAREHATDILGKSKGTKPSFSKPSSKTSTQPPRRRIAAAIYNDVDK